MRISVEASLRRLGTDYVDVLWVHAWDWATPVEEIMRGLDDLVRWPAGGARPSFSRIRCRGSPHRQPSHVVPPAGVGGRGIIELVVGTPRALDVGMGAADLDRAVTSEVRVRRWSHDGPPRRWPAGQHDALEVAWVGSGEVTYAIGRRELRVPPGSAMVLPRGIEHATAMGHGARAGSVWLGGGMVGAVARAMAGCPSPDPMVVRTTDRLARIGELLQAEAGNGDPGSVLAVEALSEAFAVETLRCTGSGDAPAASDPRIRIAVDHIRSSHAEPLGVDELARSAGMSRYHFSRVFRAQMGASPYRFLQDTRVERAAELLRSGRHSVTEVALAVGFRDLGRFGIAFRRRFGCTPSAMATRRARTDQRSARSA